MAEQFNFNISLSVLNHLGRNLYRNFITVLGEAISNSWDADATKVEIEIDENGRSFSIKDNGIGMDETDFQEKFLKIGYSKRKKGESRSPYLDRPYIGRKGIGKLALLSCAGRIHILSKKTTTHYMGGIIDNKELTKAIEDASNPEEYGLLPPNHDVFRILKKDHYEGTIIYFENTNEGINNSIKTLKKLIALYFRFSLIDPSFSISVNGDEVTSSDLKDISDKTQFLWTINKFFDPFFDTFTPKKILKEKMDMSDIDKNIRGFIASVKEPKNLNILGLGEKTGVDVFVNGRLREKNILKHMPNYGARHIAQYLYGQIHLDILDNGDPKDIDRFTSSREGIKPEDKLYKELLETITNDIFNNISRQWDIWRRKQKQDGDPDNDENIAKYERRLEESKNARVKDFEYRIDASKKLDDKAKITLKETLRNLSHSNTKVYQDLFILENIFREFLRIRGIHNRDDLNREFPDDEHVQGIPNAKGQKGEEGCIEAIERIEKLRQKDDKGQALKSNKIIKIQSDFNYLDLVWLGILVDKVNETKTGKHKRRTMTDYAKDIAPVRNVVMHTNEIFKNVADLDQISDVIDMIDELCSTSPKP